MREVAAVKIVDIMKVEVRQSSVVDFHQRQTSDEASPETHFIVVLQEDEVMLRVTIAQRGEQGFFGTHPQIKKIGKGGKFALKLDKSFRVRSPRKVHGAEKDVDLVDFGGGGFNVPFGNCTEIFGE